MLTDDQKWLVGIECEERWTALAREKSRARLDQHKLPQAMATRIKQIREKVDRGELSREEAAIRLKQYGASTFCQHKRGYRIKVVRPYKKKQAVLTTVAEWASCKFKRQIGARMVKTAWDYYLRELRRQEKVLRAPSATSSIASR